jgi:SAM-dependent methyltransferase
VLRDPEVIMFANPQAYETFMGRWSRALAPLLVEFAGIPDGALVLDLGCGTGALASSIAAANARCRVIAIDPSLEYVEHARRANTCPGRVEFQTGDAQQLQFPDGTFDCCVSSLVFNFIPDQPKALNEAVRVTKPGGRIAAAVWDYGDGMEMLRVFWDAVMARDPAVAARDERRMPLCRSGALHKLWTNAGLAEVSETWLEITMQFDSFPDFWDPFLLGQGPAGVYVQNLGPVARQDLRDEVKRRLGLLSESAPFELPARACAVRGSVPAHR